MTSPAKFTLVDRFDLDDYGWQAAAFDGTYIYVTSKGAGANNLKLAKYNLSSVQVAENATAGTDGTNMAQVNGISIHDGKVYVSSCNYPTEPKVSYIKVFNCSDLSYVEEHLVLAHWSEGAAYHDGFWWVVYHDYKYVSKYNTSWVWQANYELTFPQGAGDQGYQGITWYGDLVLVNIHENQTPHLCDVYKWNGSGFDEVIRLARLETQDSQAVYWDGTHLWWAERNYPGALENRVCRTTIDSVSPPGYDNCVGLWKMNEAAWVPDQADDVVDSSGQGNHGTAKGNANTDAAGKIGRCGIFDGAGDWIDFGDPASLKIQGDLTIDGYFKTPAAWPGGNGDYPGLVGMYGPIATYNGYLLCLRGDHKVHFEIGKGGGARDYSCQSDVALSLNTWYHFTAVRESNIQTLYIDAVAQVATSNAVMAVPTQHFHMGRYYGEINDFYWLGRTDIVKIFNRALTIQEIAWLDNGRNGIEACKSIPVLMHHYKGGS